MRHWRSAIAAATIAAAACVLVVAEGASSDRGPEQELRAQVATAVRQLGADSFRERQAAERRLLAWGPAILPLLPDPAELGDASSREGVRRIRVQLEHRQARKSVQAARVSLAGTLPLERILDEIERRTGNPLDRGQLPAERMRRELAVDFDGAPFWTALDEVAGLAGLRLEPAPQGRAVRLIESSARPPAAVAVDGAFRVAVEPATFRPLFGDATRRLARVRFSVMSEPRVRPLFLALSGKDVRAVLPSGEPLLAFDPDAKYELPLAEGGAGLSFALDFVVPADASPESLAVSGGMTVHAAAGREAIRFPILTEASGVSRRRGGATVAVGRVAIGGRAREEFTVTLPVTVSYDAGGPAFESHRQWVYHNEVHLETNAGDRLAIEPAFRTARQADGGAALEYTFRGLSGDPADYRFVYVLPTLLVDVPVKFEFPRVPVGEPRP